MVEGTDIQGNRVGQEGNLGTGRRAGFQDSSGFEGFSGWGWVFLLDVMSTDSLDSLEDSTGGVYRLLRAVLVVENLGSDPLDGGTDKSGRARSTATTKVKEDSGNGFV